ncbi:ATP-binding cassette domain-containing protein [Cryobacterium melibiosiphilum]|uniref:ATP-binding cassette domain-containing protein n=1 Tax=Cryobacterium melibiosiphilum TaxID=995039 RepID=A0A3A5MAR2_9MICO|nr:ATP-binding cassette domain-containing protein [Cryobacterium melibiosiphilum]RJT85168.1 ATP-binding cassette domain-containing protein [Cryobacterium melibiosiphilum]
MTAETTRATIIRATAMTIAGTGPRLRAGVDLHVAAGDLCVIAGSFGSGKSALALTLAGRMKASTGELTVLGHELPRQASPVRQRVALANNTAINALDDTLTVGQHVAEAIVLNGPWWRPWTTHAQVDAIIARANAVIDSLAPTNADSNADSTARQAHRLEPLWRDEIVASTQPLPRLVLGVVLALMSAPEVLVIDDLDVLRDTDDRRLAWASLLVLTTQRIPNLTIIVTCQDTRELGEAVLALAASHADGSLRRVTVLDLDLPAAALPAVPALPILEGA